MSFIKELQEAQKLEIQSYKKKPEAIKRLKESSVPFSGSPLKHPFDPKKIILIADPYSHNTFYYEFRAEDIAYVEELPSMVSIDGENITMTRLWVKKRCVGVRCTPFVVQDISVISEIY